MGLCFNGQGRVGVNREKFMSITRRKKIAFLLNNSKNVNMFGYKCPMNGCVLYNWDAMGKVSVNSIFYMMTTSNYK